MALPNCINCNKIRSHFISPCLECPRPMPWPKSEGKCDNPTWRLKKISLCFSKGFFLSVMLFHIVGKEVYYTQNYHCFFRFWIVAVSGMTHHQKFGYEMYNFIVWKMCLVYDMRTEWTTQTPWRLVQQLTVQHSWIPEITFNLWK